MLMGMYNLDPMTFVRMNPTLDCNNLIPGSVVCVSNIPITTTTTTTTTTIAPIICKTSMVVEPDDTCNIIIRYRGITMTELMRLNPSLNCQNLQVGQIICLENFSVATTVAPVITQIITTTTLAPAPVCTQTYTVKSGDTCWSISNQVTKIGDKFYTLNPTINCSFLYIGQVVCVDSCPVEKYTVKPGDYCWQISTQFNLTTEQFFAMNPGMECGSLKTGDVLNVGTTKC
jgi:LysM repeat protein